MKLFELRPVNGLVADNNPWWHGYDKCFCFIIRADSETEARKIADQNAGDENKYFKNPWQDKNYSTCIELTQGGKSGIISKELHTSY